MEQPTIVIISGEIQAGKTTFCRLMAERAEDMGLSVRGVLSPAFFEGGRKVGIQVRDVSSGAERSLARLRSSEPGDMETRRWSFDRDAAAWGSRVLEGSTPCDVLIIDELGPLEFERGQGWTAAFRVLEEGEYRAALVVVRPSLLDQALDRWPEADVLSLDPDMDLSEEADQLINQRHLGISG